MQCSGRSPRWRRRLQRLRRGPLPPRPRLCLRAARTTRRLLPSRCGADADATAWLDAMQRQIAALAAAPAAAAPRPAAAAPAAVFEGCAHDAPAASFALRRGRAEYVADVAATLEAIRAGETYEVCLTTALERSQAGVASRALYTALRACNPAPYAAWLRFGGGDGGDADADALTVCCSSPERFLRLDRNVRLGSTCLPFAQLTSLPRCYRACSKPNQLRAQRRALCRTAALQTPRPARR
jgi:hypothetical protein